MQAGVILGCCPGEQVGHIAPLDTLSCSWQGQHCPCSGTGHIPQLQVTALLFGEMPTMRCTSPGSPKHCLCRIAHSCRTQTRSSACACPMSSVPACGTPGDTRLRPQGSRDTWSAPAPPDSWYLLTRPLSLLAPPYQGHLPQAVPGHRLSRFPVPLCCWAFPLLAGGCQRAFGSNEEGPADTGTAA